MYDNDISSFINIKANEKTRQSTNNEVIRQKNRLRKTDKNVWHRVAILFNIVSKSFNPQAPIGKKTRIRTTYWNFFHKHYNEHNLCTWRILCFCRNWNPHNKLNVHWRYKSVANNTPGMKPQTWSTTTTNIFERLLVFQIYAANYRNFDGEVLTWPENLAMSIFKLIINKELEFNVWVPSGCSCSWPTLKGINEGIVLIRVVSDKHLFCLDCLNMVDFVRARQNY